MNVLYLSEFSEENVLLVESLFDEISIGFSEVDYQYHITYQYRKGKGDTFALAVKSLLDNIINGQRL